MNKKDFKLTFAKTLNSVQDAVTNPKVLKTSKVTKRLLDMAVLLASSGVKGPVGIASAVVSSVSMINDVLELPENRFIMAYIEEHKLIAASSKIPEILNRLGLFSKLECFHDAPSMTLYRYIHDNGEEIIFSAKGNEISQVYYRSAGFKTRYLRHLIWPDTLDVFLLSYDDSLDIQPTVFRDTDNYMNFGNHYEMIQKHITKSHERNISYAATLLGNPGSGKTTFVHKLAKEMNLKLLHVASDVIEDVTSSQFEEIVNTLQPDILLLDDVDRAEFEEGLMAAIEPIREKNPKTIVIATANSWPGDALMRPGRLGDIMIFYPPRTAKERAELLAHYMKFYEVDPNNYSIDKLAKIIEHPSLTQDYIRFVAQKAMILDDKELIEFAIVTKNHHETMNPTKKHPEGYRLRPQGGSHLHGFNSAKTIFGEEFDSTVNGEIDEDGKYVENWDNLEDNLKGR